MTAHLPETATERTFPLIAGALGAVARRAGKDLTARERELVSTVQQLALIQEIAQPLRLRHDVLKALRQTAIWPTLVAAGREGRLPEMGETLDAEEALLTAGARLNEGLTVPIAPTALLVEQLRVQLWPTPLDVHGEDRVDEMEPRRAGPGWDLDRARDRIWLIQVADGFAVSLRRAFPVDALGRPRLQRVILSFESSGDEVILGLRPIPAQPSRTRTESALLARLARQLDGSLIEGYEDGLLSMRVRASVFAR